MKVATSIFWLVLVSVWDTFSALERDVDTPKSKSTPSPTSPGLAGRQADGSPTVSPFPTSAPNGSQSPNTPVSPNPTAPIPTKASDPPIPTIAPIGVEESTNGTPSTTSPTTTDKPSMSPTLTASPTATSYPTGRNEETPTETGDLGIQIPPDESDCWGNLTDILMDQRQYTFLETNVKRTYIVCPNKLYETGSTDQNGNFDPNFHAIFGMRRNVEYRCGADGSSSNNCIIRGIDSFGELAMVGVPDIFVNDCSSADRPQDAKCDFIIDNFTFRGFTLEDTVVSSIFMVAQVGRNILFDDIVLRNAPMWRHMMISKYSERRRRGLRDTIPKELANRWPWNFHVPSNRRLQDEEDFSGLDYTTYPYELTITNSKFINNTILQCPRFVQCAEENPNFNFLISTDSLFTTINVHNSVFENNDFSKPLNAETLPYGFSHMIAVDWNSSMTNNTFINNTVTSSLIRMFDDTANQTLTLADNYVEPSTAVADYDDGVDCTFALIGGIIYLDNATCVEANRTSSPPPTTMGSPTSSPTGGRLTRPGTPEPGMTYLPTQTPSLEPPTASDATSIRRISLNGLWTLLGALMLMLPML